MTVSVRSARYRPPLSRRELLGRGSASAWDAPLGAPPELAVIALNRMGFGPRPGDIAAFNALGGDDISRLTAYVDQQLAPNDADDPAYLERRNGLNGLPNPNFLTLGWTLQQTWEAFEVSPTTQSPSNRPAEETRLDTLCRMVYSKWQLREVLADFWHNHFNVYGFENYTQESLVHYDRDVIRPHLFGNFRELLEAVARSTTMLYFLDNYTNTRQGPNENYGRELFELHTLGAENYFGVGNQADVPPWGVGVVWPAGLPSAGQPIPAGYVDNDVYESARSFTGWGVTYATGQYAYTAANHDVFQKAVLSLGVVNIPPNQADEKDGTDVLDMLAAHPGTGRHIARKLCRRLIADDPPAALVESIGDLFTSLREAPDQIAQVVRAIVLSPEFSSTWGAKIKRPVEFTVSAMRAASPNWLFGYSAQGNPPTMESDMSSLLSRQTKTDTTCSCASLRTASPIASRSGRAPTPASSAGGLPAG
ncbi:MAG: DUF1800 domain-containing protein [Thermoanaerobaculia bacterium]